VEPILTVTIRVSTLQPTRRDARTRETRTHLARDALDHRFPLRLRIVRARAAAENAAEVLAVRVRVVRGRGRVGAVQDARVRERGRRAVAPEAALGEQLDLLVVRVARDGARGAEPARRGAGEAEVDGLAERPARVGAGGELVRERGGGLVDERVLGAQDVLERLRGRRGAHRRRWTV
jgi:hypothetical protein